MYIRILDRTIRYRISKQESEQSINDETLFDSLDLSEKFNLSYSIVAVNKHSSFVFNQDNNLMSLQINKNELIGELKDRPSKKGIEITEIISEDKKRSVFLEINIKRIKK